MKLNLLKAEKIELLKNGSITVERKLRHVPLSSVMYGIGNKALFDKVDYLWIFGDTESYKRDYMNKGRRKKDYPDNKKNVWSGSFWWDCEHDLNPFETIDGVTRNGIKNAILFKTTHIVLDRLEDVRVKDCTFTEGTPKGIDLETVVYKKPLLKFNLELVANFATLPVLDTLKK